MNNKYFKILTPIKWGYKVSCGFGGSKLWILEEQSVLLTADPFLHPPTLKFMFTRNICSWMFMTASFITSQSGNKMSINQGQDKQDVHIIQLCKKWDTEPNYSSS